jgi:hypothetical protein
VNEHEDEDDCLPNPEPRRGFTTEAQRHGALEFRSQKADELTALGPMFFAR